MFTPSQLKASLEKAKQTLEMERAELVSEVRALQSGRAESDHKRKRVETQLQEVQARLGESERVRAELGEKTQKLQVRIAARHSLTTAARHCQRSCYNGKNTCIVWYCHCNTLEMCCCRYNTLLSFMMAIRQYCVRERV